MAHRVVQCRPGSGRTCQRGHTARRRADAAPARRAPRAVQQRAGRRSQRSLACGWDGTGESRRQAPEHAPPVCVVAVHADAVHQQGFHAGVDVALRRRGQQLRSGTARPRERAAAAASHVAAPPPGGAAPAAPAARRRPTTHAARGGEHPRDAWRPRRVDAEARRNFAAGTTRSAQPLRSAAPSALDGAMAFCVSASQVRGCWKRRHRPKKRAHAASARLAASRPAALRSHARALGNAS